MLFFFLNFNTKHGEKIFLPNFIGLNAEDAKTKILELGLEYQIIDSVYDLTKPSGTILEQNPVSTVFSTTYVKTGRIISLRVTKSTKLIEMPSLVDKQINFAESVLTSRGLKYIIKYKLIAERHGAVMEQLYKGRKIAPGEKIEIGSQITLIVGQKSEEKTMPIPNLIGLNAEACRAIMDSLKSPYLFKYDNCLTKEDSLSATVLLQSPEFLPGQTTFPSSTFIIRIGFADRRKESDEDIEFD